MNRPRALIVCGRPKAYEPTRVHEAATYLAQMPGATEDEKRLAAGAIEWLRGKQDEPKAASKRTRGGSPTSSDRPAVKPKRKGRP